MRRACWGLTAVLLLAACPSSDHVPSAAQRRRDGVVRAEAQRRYALRIQADADSNALAMMGERLAAVIVPTTHVHRPKPRASRSAPRRRGGCKQRSLEQIAQDESGGNYTAQNPRSSASGKYQVLDGTWDGYGGYKRAKDAPPHVQEQWAREAYAKSGSRPWRASGC